MWALDPSIRHLNHGSFGAVLEEVLDSQTEWRRRFESNPTRFVMRDLQPGIDAARASVARFVGSDDAGIVFTRNATTGVASVLRSIEHRLGPNDQVVTTSHDYNAVRQILNFTAERTGVEIVVAKIPFPISDPADVIDAVDRAVTDRTRLAVIDHITSPTALVYPIREIVGHLEPDVPVLVDGAHGPGQVPLDLEALGASWYTGNLHKWVCAPKGAALLHTRADRRAATVPTVISHGFNAPIEQAKDRYNLLFDWLGTDDFSPWLVLPDVLRLVSALHPGGWDGIIEANHRLVLQARDEVATAIGAGPAAPGSMVGSMASIVLPDAAGADPGGDLSPLMSTILDRGFEVLVMSWPRWPRQLLRISAHLYNEIEEYRELAAELARLVA
ncbi:MAG: aminotransferase class V-fold PLP-dependent enzyme [Acidimicrobiia bacterium]